MAQARSTLETMALLAQATRARYGTVPDVLGGYPIPAQTLHFSAGEFIFRTDSGYAFHYVPGHGVTVDKAAGADPDEEELWLNGTVYCAVACLHGLYPVHASAIAHAGRAYAFTGPSGAGKSTLAAGLGNLGMPLFCDDTLLLDLSDPDRILALPGHKRLKLTAHGLTLTGLEESQPVGADTGKSYAVSIGGVIAQPLPLGGLIFLEQGESLAWDRLGGAERFSRLEEDHYTHAIHRECLRPDRATQFALRTRLASQVAMYRFARPVGNGAFGAMLDFAKARLHAITGP